MDLQNFKVSFGKTILVFNLLMPKVPTLLNSNWPLRITNVHSSSSWLFINPKDLAMIQMVFLDYLLTKI